MNIIDAIKDPKVFGPFFKGNTWDVWFVFLAALFALPLTPEQLELYTKYTGRKVAPAHPLHEAWLVCGRRAGKSFILAIVAVFLGAFTDWRPFLGPGEVGTIMVICADRRQARTIMRYCLGLLKAVPMLKQLIESETRESITLRNRIVIEVHTASFRSTRGYTCVTALLDEVAYWPVDESAAEVDVEVLNAIRPSMATIPGAMLLAASSPHARKGALWSAYNKHYGKDGDEVLVWKAATRDMNASVPQSFIDQHMAEDPARAQAEYMAQFRSDLEGYVLREAVEACVNTGIRERAQRGIVYTGFVDPSGGSVDSMTLAIAHRDQDVVVIDALRERVPLFSPEQVVGEFAELLKSYNVTRITGDRFANVWPVEVFANAGIAYEQSAEPKSVLYTNMLPLLNSCRIELLDHSKTINQLIALERRTARGGRESIDHPPSGHDDLINAVAGAAVGALSEPNGAYIHRLMGDDDDPDGSKAWRAMRLMDSFVIDSRVDPRLIRPLLEPAIQKVIDEFTITSPPEIHAEIAGRWSDPEHTMARATIAITNAGYRGQVALEARALITLTNQVLSILDPVVVRPEGTGRADSVVLDFPRQRLFINHANGSLDARAVVTAVGSNVAQLMEPYRFLQAPHGRVDGFVNLEDGSLSDLRFQLGGGPFEWRSFRFQQITGDVHWVGPSLTLSNLHGTLHGGELDASMRFAFTDKDGANFAFTTVATNINLRSLIKDIGNATNTLEGTLSGRLVITNANTELPRSWFGYGDASLKDGLIWEVPVFGLFSPVLNVIVPGSGNNRAKEAEATFIITNSVIRTDNLEIQASGMRLTYEGWIDFDTRLDGRMEAALFRDTPGVGPFVSTVFSPLTKLLEYKVTGTLNKPKSEPLYVPKIFMVPFHPLRSLRELMESGKEETTPPPFRLKPSE